MQLKLGQCAVELLCKCVQLKDAKATLQDPRCHGPGFTFRLASSLSTITRHMWNFIQCALLPGAFGYGLDWTEAAVWGLQPYRRTVSDLSAAGAGRGNSRSTWSSTPWWQWWLQTAGWTRQSQIWCWGWSQKKKEWAGYREESGG